MSFFTWSDKFSVGNEVIDRDHMVLVDLIDQLHEASVGGKADAVVGTVLSALVDYTRTHFDREEKMMADAGYPDLANHKQVHQKLRRQVEEVYDRHLAGEDEGKISVDMLAFLHDWLYFHILETDRDYLPYLSGK